MKRDTPIGFCCGMFVTTVVLLGGTVIVSAAIVAYPQVSVFGKGFLIIVCVIAHVSIYHEGLIWKRAWIDYKAGESE